MTQIAIFDSGIGGTTVLGRVRDRAPWADLVYVADHAFGPYGERTLDEVRTRTELLARYLVSAGVSEIVIACNSASAAALHHLRDVLPDVAFVGMEPAVKPATELTRNGIVAILATGATFQGELFRSLVGQHASDVTVIEQACPGLAAAVESGAQVGPLLDRFLPPVVRAGADVVVLGCTHYPLIRSEIEERLGEGTVVVDPSDAVAKQVVAVAHDHEIDLKGVASTVYWTTGLETEHDDGLRWTTIDIPESAAGAVRTGETTMSAVLGDITTMLVDAVVNAANKQLIHGGGIALAIALAGGESINDESRVWIDEYGSLEPGTAALTSAGRMPASYVIHVAGPIYAEGKENEELLAAAVFGALDTASEIDAESVAMPAISAGIYGYPADEATVVIAESVAEFIDNTGTALRSVRLVGYDDAMTKRFAAAISSVT
ncbi:MAG: glutamate racemase [Actinobacteria bacterium]|nr:MAG: glutamate racemase [Actinomycetota bacterium]